MMVSRFEHDSDIFCSFSEARSEVSHGIRNNNPGLGHNNDLTVAIGTRFMGAEVATASDIRNTFLDLRSTSLTLALEHRRIFPISS